LQDEFSRLYPSLFTDAEKHIAVIRSLATTKQGLTRKRLVEQLPFSEGGTLKKILEELEQSGFIASYRPFNKKKKEKLYRLIDEYSHFYLTFIEGKEHEGNDIWHHLSQTQAFTSWSGYAFESLCLKHIPQIKKALSIAGIYSLSSSFYKKGTATDKGIQIDLLIDRSDHTINLLELKFYKENFTLTKVYAEQLRTKMSIFRKATKTTKQLSWVLLTTFGMEANQHSLGLIQQALTMDDLFN